MLIGRFDVFGSGFGEKVLGYYPICEFDTPQQVYDRISADIGVVCGNIYLVWYFVHYSL